MKTITKFKQTEIGNIPRDWQVKELKEVLKEKGYIRGPFGSSLRRPELKTKGIPVYEQEHAIYKKRSFRFFIDDEKFEKLSRFAVKENDLIVSCSGTLGKVSLISKNDPHGIISQALLILRPDSKKIDPRFFYYFFDSVQGFKSLVSRSIGSVQVNLAKREIIEKIQLPIPPHSEQLAIVKFLANLDSKMALNQEMNETLGEISRAIYKHWFVDFEFPNDEGKPYKSSGGEMIHNEELGIKIPKGWIFTPLNEIADFTRGFSYRGSEKSNLNGEFVFVTLNSVKEGGGFKREFSYITSDRIKEKHFVRSGDIVIANTEQTKTGTLLGCPALVEFPLYYEKNKSIFSHHITKATAKLKHSKYFLYHYLYSNQRNSIQYNTGSVIWALDVSNWSKNEKIILPDQITLKKFEQFMENIFQKILKNNLQIEIISNLKELLAPKLLLGEIRVPLEEKQ